MLSPALFVMYTRTVSADAGNAAKASKSQKRLKPIRERFEVLELIADLLYGTGEASLGVGAFQGQGVPLRKRSGCSMVARLAGC